MDAATRATLDRHFESSRVACLSAEVSNTRFLLQIATEAAEESRDTTFGASYLHVSVEKVGYAACSLANTIDRVKRSIADDRQP